MPEWLGDEWSSTFAAHLAALPAVVELVVTGGPGGERRWHWAYRGGAPGAGAPGPAEGAAVAFTLGEPDARALLTGEGEPSVAFMRGRMKSAGDPGLVLRLLEATSGPAYEAWRSDLAALTTF